MAGKDDIKIIGSTIKIIIVTITSNDNNDNNAYKYTIIET